MTVGVVQGNFGIHDKTSRERLAAYQAVDFDDLLGLPHKLLQRDAEARAKWQDTLRYVLVDDAGEPLFMGEDEIEPAPAGSELGVKIGEAFDVTVQSSVVASEKIDSVHTRYSMSYVLHNARPEPVIVELRQSGFWRDGKIETESLPSRRIDAYTYDWSVKVPANGEATLTFTADAGG